MEVSANEIANTMVSDGSAVAAELTPELPEPRQGPAPKARRTDDDVLLELEDKADHHAFAPSAPDVADSIDDSQDYQAQSFQKIQEDLSKNYEITAEQHYYLNQKSQELFEAKQFLDQKYSEINWSELKESDPQRYLLLQHEFRDAYGRVQNDYSQLNQLAEGQKERQKQQYQKHLSQQMDMVKRMIPSWQDDNVRSKETTLIRNELVKSYGFQNDELDSVTDARLVRVLRDLVKYKQAAQKRAIKNRSSAQKRVAKKFTQADTTTPAVKGSADWVAQNILKRMK